MSTPIETFDLRDTIISFSFLQISNLFSRMKAGQFIEIIGCDERIVQDLIRILTGSKYEVVFSGRRDLQDIGFSIMLTKRLK